MLEIVTGPLFAVVRGDGTLARGSVGATAEKAGTGLPGSSGTAPPVFLGVAGAATDVKGVFVTTRNVQGVAVDQSLHLIVVSP